MPLPLPVCLVNHFLNLFYSYHSLQEKQVVISDSSVMFWVAKSFWTLVVQVGLQTMHLISDLEVELMK